MSKPAQTESAQRYHRASERTCTKATHGGMGFGYLHARDDDGPYDVDGCTYCGRCHHAIDTKGECSPRIVPESAQARGELIGPEWDRLVERVLVGRMTTREGLAEAHSTGIAEGRRLEREHAIERARELVALVGHCDDPACEGKMSHHEQPESAQASGVEPTLRELTAAAYGTGGLVATSRDAVYTAGIAEGRRLERERICHQLDVTARLYGDMTERGQAIEGAATILRAAQDEPAPPAASEGKE